LSGIIESRFYEGCFVKSSLSLHISRTALEWPILKIPRRGA
jgi:hypothetical protein